ncbi:MAG TPA: NAD(P)-binding domain-containing protein [Umezawaea sp.]|nr:NAD(P)-binding domain-containing protein [Umezawaea sp.]
MTAVGVLGTGPVALMLAERLTEIGHDVVLGSREPRAKAGLGPRVESLADTVAASAVLINAPPGLTSLATLTAVGPDLFAGKVLIDLANAVTADFDLVYPNSSLAEKLQEALPAAEVVNIGHFNININVRPTN